MESLEDFIDKTCAESPFRVEQDLGEGFVRLKSGEAQRRQAAQDIRCSEDVLLELLRNSLDAGARHIFIATGAVGALRRLVVIDDGQGIPASMHSLIFEARVTSKLDSAHSDRWGFHGRGMALFSVAQRTREALVVNASSDLGTSIAVTIDTAALPEKTDQSTMPHLVPKEGDQWALRGPKNLLRVACEFALEYQNRTLVFIGSSAEIAATLYAVGIDQTTAHERATVKDLDVIPFWLRPAYAADPAELRGACLDVGLELSERSARRILNGELAPAYPLTSLLSTQINAAKTSRKPSAWRGAVRPLHLSAPDKESLQTSVAESVATLGERYYFRIVDAATIKASEHAITITVPIEFE